MESARKRHAVDLSAWPDLVVVYLGMKVQRWRGVMTVLGLGKGIGASVAGKPEGLLAHETIIWGLSHIGMRQYWRDLESLERFTRSAPHKDWWKEFSRDGKGTGFWHETYRMRGGMEAIYLDMPAVGFAKFATPRAAEGGYKSARGRLEQANVSAAPAEQAFQRLA